MSEEHGQDDHSLMPIVPPNLVPITSINPLVSRGIADIARNSQHQKVEPNHSDFEAASEYFRQGNEYYENGEYERSFQAFDEAIRLAPTWHLFYFRRGHARWGIGDYDKAIADLSDAIAHSPKRAIYYMIRAEVWIDKHHYDQAIQDFTQAIPHSFDDARQLALAHSRRGAAYRSRGSARIRNDQLIDIDACIADFKNGINDYAEALKWEPDSEMTHELQQRMSELRQLLELTLKGAGR